MGTYCVNTEIQARTGNRPLTSTSKPSTGDVDAWIDEAEAEILGALRAAGIETSYAAGTGGFRILRGWIGNYVAGLVRVAWAAAGGDGGNADGRELVTAWRTLLINIGSDTAHYSAMLGSTGTADASALTISSHVTDRTLGLTSADVAPTFLSGRNDSRNY